VTIPDSSPKLVLERCAGWFIGDVSSFCLAYLDYLRHYAWLASVRLFATVDLILWQSGRKSAASDDSFGLLQPAL